MKQISYILISLILLSACASSENNTRQTDKHIEKDSIAITHHYDSHLIKQQPVKKDSISVYQKEADTISTADFNNISAQKIQQFMDMLSAISNPKNPQGLQIYIDKHVERLCANPQQAKQILNIPIIKNADSIRLTQCELLNFEEKTDWESLGNYKIKLAIYKDKKKQYQSGFAKMYFKIDDLNIDGKIYKTISAKILELKF